MIGLAGFSTESGFSPWLGDMIYALSAAKHIHDWLDVQDAAFILQLCFPFISFIFHGVMVDSARNSEHKPPIRQLMLPPFFFFFFPQILEMHREREDARD